MTKRLKNDLSVDLLRAAHRALFDKCIDYAETSLYAGEDEEAARWLLVAARSADAFGCGQLVSSRLERSALLLAHRIPPHSSSSTTESGAIVQRRWLHVMSIAYPVGGHTAFVRRWIEADDSSDQHHLALTQMTEIDLPALTSAVARRGGRVTMLGEYSKLTDKAWHLRRLASQDADCIVLHIHMWDVVPTIAFGVAGGPPVLLLNHADHTFWVGAAVADRVIEFRKAGADLTRRYRAVDRILELPIPLPSLPEPAARRLALRASLRDAWSIPPAALVFLTIGHHSKYLPVGDLDYMTTALRLLTHLPEAYLIAVGPSPHDRLWGETAARVQQRIIAVGPQIDLAPYHSAADIYLESFPRGSITALLEASQSGLPVVRLPASAPLPASAQYPPLTAIYQPPDVDGYLAMALHFARSPVDRRAAAAALGKATEEFQGAAAWRAKLDALKCAVPAVHQVYPTFFSVDADLELDRFWTTFRQMHGPHDPVSRILSQALNLDLIGLLPGLNFLARVIRPHLTCARPTNHLFDVDPRGMLGNIILAWAVSATLAIGAKMFGFPVISELIGYVVDVLGMLMLFALYDWFTKKPEGGDGPA
jgi:hypothetical protein